MARPPEAASGDAFMSPEAGVEETLSKTSRVFADGAVRPTGPAGAAPATAMTDTADALLFSVIAEPVRFERLRSIPGRDAWGCPARLGGWTPLSSGNGPAGQAVRPVVNNASAEPGTFAGAFVSTGESPPARAMPACALKLRAPSAERRGVREPG
jgi:hypothetical protein